MLPILFGRHTAVVIVSERQIQEQHSGDLGLQLGHTVDDIVAKIKHRGLDKGAMIQLQVVGDLLFDLGTDRDTVIVVREHSRICEVVPVVNKGGADGIVANGRNGEDPVFKANQSA